MGLGRGHCSANCSLEDTNTQGQDGAFLGKEKGQCQPGEKGVQGSKGEMGGQKEPVFLVSRGLAK